MDIFPGKVKFISKPITILMTCLLMILLFISILNKYIYPLPYMIEVRPINNLTYDLALRDNDSELLFIEINPNLHHSNRVLFSGIDIDIEQLGEQLQKRLSTRSLNRQVVYIKSHKDVSYGYVYKIIDIVKGSNVKTIQLQIDHLTPAESERY